MASLKDCIIPRSLGNESEVHHRADARLKIAAPFCLLSLVLLLGFGGYFLVGKARVYWARRKKDLLFARLARDSEIAHYGYGSA